MCRCSVDTSVRAGLQTVQVSLHTSCRPVCSCSLCPWCQTLALQWNRHLDMILFSDFQVAGSQTLKESGKPVKVAESDVDVSRSFIFLLEPSTSSLDLLHY